MRRPSRLAPSRRTHPPAAAAARNVPFDGLTFCVVDVETTGLSPQADRVVELALVRADRHGRVEQEISTLINPDGPVGATMIHGITDDDVLGAPYFSDLGEVIEAMLDGTVVVAHNASFDTGFLRAEITRCGLEIDPLPYVCTMRLRRQVGLPGPSAHKLKWACWQQGVAIESAHAAICDARATGALLSHYVRFAAECGHGCLGDLPAKGVAADSWLDPLPDRGFSFDGTLQVRQRPGITPPGASLHRHVSAPAQAARAYELSLAAAAADFEIDEDEVDELHALVCDLGLTSEQVRAVHVAHVERLLEDRLDDGLLTWAEQHEVRAFARLLGVPQQRVDEMLQRASAVATVEAKPAPQQTGASGVTVCFTGEFTAIPLTRDEVSELAAESGMEALPRVTKKLDLLVCLDPAAGTGKLQKAAEYGTVIIDQPTFLAVAGVEPAPEGVVSGVLERLAARRHEQVSAAELKREAAARRARERARARAEAASAGSTEEQVLWCVAGQHEWSRTAHRGRPPKACPEHQGPSVKAG